MPAATAPRMPRCHRTRVSHSADDAGLLSLLCGLDLAQRSLVHPAGEQDAVEMIDLVLNGAGQQPVPFDPDLLAVAVQSLGDDSLAAGRLANPSGHREAALETGLVALAANHLRVGDLVDLIVDPEDDDARRHPALRAARTAPVGA